MEKEKSMLKERLSRLYDLVLCYKIELKLRLKRMGRKRSPWELGEGKVCGGVLKSPLTGKPLEEEYSNSYRNRDS